MYLQSVYNYVVRSGILRKVFVDGSGTVCKIKLPRIIGKDIQYHLAGTRIVMTDPLCSVVLTASGSSNGNYDLITKVKTCM